MTKILSKINLRAIFTLLFPLLNYNIVYSQEKPIKYEIESQTIGTTNDLVPFWMRSNQFGSVPLSGISQSFIGRAYRDFALLPPKDSTDQKRKLLDWGFGFEGRANIGSGSNLQLIEGYTKVRVGVFNITAGRSRNVMGLNGDTVLSSGNFAVSGNAPGIPRLELSIPEYYSVPILDGLFSVKGNFSHGWIGKEDIYRSVTGNYEPTTYFHQKSLYLKIGKKDWKLKVYGGFNHQAYWGNEKTAYGSEYKLSNPKTFYYVVTGKRYGSSKVPFSKIGNQIGSLDLGAEYEFNLIKVMIYRQNIYDVGALSKLANIKDGLNGIMLENKAFNKSMSTFKWKKILIEYFYTKDQAGYPWSKATQSGDENYYNNFYYVNGWTYSGLGMGNPLITKAADARPGQASYPTDYFINNRVSSFHLGFEGSLYNWSVITKMTYSKNYGTFGTSSYGHTLAGTGPIQTTNLFLPVNQFSFYLEAMKPFKNKFSAGFITAFDRGELLNNSAGLSLRIKKVF